MAPADPTTRAADESTRRPLVPRIGGGDDWWSRVWVPAARDSLRRRRHMVGDRAWPLRVLWARSVACRIPEPDRGSALGRWTCQRHRWHEGAHRFRNYVWSDRDDRTHYEPMPVHGNGMTTW